MSFVDELDWLRSPFWFPQFVHLLNVAVTFRLAFSGAYVYRRAEGIAAKVAALATLATTVCSPAQGWTAIQHESLRGLWLSKGVKTCSHAMGWLHDVDVRKVHPINCSQKMSRKAREPQLPGQRCWATDAPAACAAGCGLCRINSVKSRSFEAWQIGLKVEHEAPPDCR